MDILNKPNEPNETNFFVQLKGKNPESVNLQAIISKNRATHILEYNWYLGKNGYPFTYIKGARVPLHKYIWYLKTGNWNTDNLFIDHADRNKLNATDDNLRLATPAENSYNKSSKSNIIDPTTNKPLHHIKWKKTGYEVSLTKDGKSNKIDKIASLEDAKNIYNIIATELFGEFAVLY